MRYLQKTFLWNEIFQVKNYFTDVIVLSLAVFNFLFFFGAAPFSEENGSSYLFFIELYIETNAQFPFGTFQKAPNLKPINSEVCLISFNDKGLSYRCFPEKCLKYPEKLFSETVSNSWFWTLLLLLFFHLFKVDKFTS